MDVLDRVRVEWAATVFGLLVGITMVYVPYEFGSSPFQTIYTHVRLLGGMFLVGSIAQIACLLYPSWPVGIGWLGRALFLGALGTYWWAVSLVSGGLTGAFLYPLMTASMIAEALPRWRGRGLFSAFLAVVAVGFAGLMLAEPTAFGPVLYSSLQPIVRPVGVLYLSAGVLLTFGLIRRRPGLSRLALGVLGALFLHMAFVLAVAVSWIGMELYLVLAAGCFLVVLMRRLPQPSGVRWRLFRGMAIASVLPVLAVGALASFVAQRAIERELRSKAETAVDSEVAWLEQNVAAARNVLRAQAQEPAFLAATRSRDIATLEARVHQFENQSGQFDAAWMLDGTGTTLVPSVALGSLRGHFAHREYFQRAQQARHESEVFLSQPFLGAGGQPVVVFAIPVDVEAEHPAVLVGALSLPRLRLQRTLAARSYHVELFDQRDGALLRETDRNDVLTRAPILDLVDAADLSTPMGMNEAFEPSGRRLLVAHAQVPGTPWTVVVTAYLREAFAPLTRLSALVVGIALLAGAVALLLSRWAGRDVAQRLEALRDGFAALGTLPLEHPVPARGNDELAQLTSGFNEMAARIERTQQELREAVALRDQFLSMASHELRTPLTPLKATVAMLLRQEAGVPPLSPDKQRSTIMRLQRQVDRLTRLVGDMLDVSRMQSGRFSLNRTPLEVGALAREVVDRIQHSRPERSAPIQLELPEGPLTGEWDEQRLDQLLTNLIENAVRYSPPDTPIQVRIHPEDGDALLEVEDRGIGISAESLPHLFAPFYRAQNAALHYAGGLGLGLAICREIVERHGGTLWATSAGPGQGSRFSVRLPRAAPSG